MHACLRITSDDRRVQKLRISGYISSVLESSARSIKPCRLTDEHLCNALGVLSEVGVCASHMFCPAVEQQYHFQTLPVLPLSEAACPEPLLGRIPARQPLKQEHCNPLYHFFSLLSSANLGAPIRADRIAVIFISPS